MTSIRSVTAALSLAVFALATPPSHAADGPAVKDVLKTYADIAEATFTDSFIAAKALDKVVDALIATPNDQTLAEARKAWVDARKPYTESEAFRFGNKIVDDWEGQVNSWPLDEGLIDYVSDAYGTENPENELYAANVIANTSIKIGGKTVDTSKITVELLTGSLQEAGGVEANVATGYHAIEFLLWGQDLNGTGPGAGNRPATDYDTKACTHGNCERRAQYLKTVTSLLVSDLETMSKAWGKDGEARAEIMKDETAGLSAIFTGLGSLSYGELAGERMKLGLLIHDPEEETDCFSDNTYNGLFGDQQGIRNVYLGRYTRIDGNVVSGPSVSDLVKAKDPKVDESVRAALDQTTERMTALVTRGKTIEAYDQMIGQGNKEGNAVVKAAIDSLIAQAKDLERAVASLELKDIKFEGSDSLEQAYKD